MNRRRCASALSTRQASWRGSPPPLGKTLAPSHSTRVPAGKTCSATKFLRLKRRKHLRARAAMGGSRARGSRLSNRPGRGRLRIVISCYCRTPQRVTMTSTRGSWGTSCSRTGGQWSLSLGPNATAAGQASPPPCLRPPSPARCSTPGPAAMATWPAEVRALAPRLYGVRISSAQFGPVPSLPAVRMVLVASAGKARVESLRTPAS